MIQFARGTSYAVTQQQAIAHYRILSKLGEGGMGAVYRAHDTKLGRDVAIKVLPPALANDADYIARFQREAQVLAALNHPNIAAIYGLEENAIVMELVEGAEPKGPLPLDEAIHIAKQIADALEAAHERGIIHRDLKPANIRITPDGTVKVLDFGLAKATEPAKAQSASPDSPTLTIAATQAGIILGTGAYMSPEQARGRPVDRRADIWAFGVVLWELLTGRQMFQGETISDVLANVLRAEPDLNAVPQQIRPVIAACLEQNPRDRLRAIGDWRRLLAQPAVETAAPARTPWLIAAAFAVFSIGAGWMVSRTTTASEPRSMAIVRGEIGGKETVLGPRYPGHLFAISPDGTKLAFVTADPTASSGMSMAIRDLTSRRFQMIPGTDGAFSPFFSPDGTWIAFGADGKLRKIRTDGTAAAVICDLPPLRGGVWLPDDQLIVSHQSGPLLRVPADGGEPVPITKLENGEGRHRSPQIMRNSDVLLFVSTGSGTVSDLGLHAINLKTGVHKLLQNGAIFGRELPTGHVMFQKESTVYAARFDADSLELTGTPVPLLDDIHWNATGGGILSVAEIGTLVYSLTGRPNTRLFRVRRGGVAEPYPFKTPGGGPQVSPDGKQVAFIRDWQIWVADLQRHTEQRLNTPRMVRFNLTWTPDGRYLAFVLPDGIWRIRPDGSSRAERLTKDSDLPLPWSFSPDGRFLLVAVKGSSIASNNLYTMRVSTDPARAEARQLYVEDYTADGAVFSPDGRWVAYHSEADGSARVYVQPFPGPGLRVQVSRGWGQQPRWSRGKNELLYQGGDRRIMVAPYEVRGATFVPGEPRPWANERSYDIAGIPTYDVTPDGEHVVLVSNLDGDDGGEVHLNFVFNFFDEVKRRVP